MNKGFLYWNFELLKKMRCVQCSHKMRCFMSDILSLGLVGFLPSIRDVQLCFPRGCAHSGGGQAEKEVGGQVLNLLIPVFVENETDLRYISNCFIYSEKSEDETN